MIFNILVSFQISGELTLHEVQNEDTWGDGLGGHLDPPLEEEREEEHSDKTFTGQSCPRTLWFGFTECWSWVEQWEKDRLTKKTSLITIYITFCLFPCYEKKETHVIDKEHLKMQKVQKRQTLLFGSGFIEPHLLLSQHQWGPAWCNPSSLACCPNPGCNINDDEVVTLNKMPTLIPLWIFVGVLHLGPPAPEISPRLVDHRLRSVGRGEKK